MRKAAGMARAIQKGEMESVPGTPSAEMAKMSPKSLKEFAHTSEARLPEKVGKPKPKGRQSKPGQKAKFIDTTLNKRKF